MAVLVWALVSALGWSVVLWWLGIMTGKELGWVAIVVGGGLMLGLLVRGRE